MAAFVRPITFQTARNRMATAFRDDPDFRNSYKANIAMLIYDDQCSGEEGYYDRPSTDLDTVPGCNEIADRLLTLIFGDVPPDEKPEIPEETDFKKEIVSRYQMLDI